MNLNDIIQPILDQLQGVFQNILGTISDRVVGSASGSAEDAIAYSSDRAEGFSSQFSSGSSRR